MMYMKVKHYSCRKKSPHLIKAARRRRVNATTGGDEQLAQSCRRTSLRRSQLLISDAVLKFERPRGQY